MIVYIFNILAQSISNNSMTFCRINQPIKTPVKKPMTAVTIFAMMA